MIKLWSIPSRFGVGDGLSRGVHLLLGSQGAGWSGGCQEWNGMELTSSLEKVLLKAAETVGRSLECRSRSSPLPMRTALGPKQLECLKAWSIVMNRMEMISSWGQKLLKSCINI